MAHVEADLVLGANETGRRHEYDTVGGNGSLARLTDSELQECSAHLTELAVSKRLSCNNAEILHASDELFRADSLLVVRAGINTNLDRNSGFAKNRN